MANISGKVIFIILLSFSSAYSGTEEALSETGIELPYPESVTIRVPEIRLPYFNKEKYVTAILKIDKKGKTEDILWEENSDSLLVKYFSPNLRAIRFHPGTTDMKKSNFLLPIRLHYRVRGRIPDLIFPVDSFGIVADRDWYEKALSLNGYEKPELSIFPPFFCDLAWTDSSRHYPYCLFQLSLDSKGQLTGIDEISNKYHTFSRQLMSAAQWAKFVPAKINGKNSNSNVYMMVSFFPQIFYPNKGYDNSKRDSYGLLERVQVRLFVDTVGLLSKPLPRKLKGNKYIYRGEHKRAIDTIIGYISISKEGQGKLWRFTKTDQKMKKTLYKIMEQLTYFPAIDYQGKPHEFNGMISFIFDGSSTIRINYHWLPESQADIVR